MEGVDHLLNSLNGNIVFNGLIMFVMNLGGRYLAAEIPDSMNEIMAKPWFRRLTIFSIAFIATRNIKVALFITLIMIVLMKFLLNEKSRACVLPRRSRTQNITQEQYTNAKNIVERYEKQNRKNALF